MKKILFKLLFTKTERFIIINALVYQSTNVKKTDGVRKQTFAKACNIIAAKLNSYL